MLTYNHFNLVCESFLFVCVKKFVCSLIASFHSFELTDLELHLESTVDPFEHFCNTTEVVIINSKYTLSVVDIFTFLLESTWGKRRICYSHVERLPGWPLGFHLDDCQHFITLQEKGHKNFNPALQIIIKKRSLP